MDPMQVSARFAAFVWFTERNGNDPVTEKAATHFANENWRSFLPLAHEGLGRLLLKIGEPRLGPPQKRERPFLVADKTRRQELAAAR